MFIDYFVCVCVCARVCACFCVHIVLNLERISSFRVRPSNNVGAVPVPTDAARNVFRLARPQDK